MQQLTLLIKQSTWIRCNFANSKATPFWHPKPNSPLWCPLGWESSFQASRTEPNKLWDMLRHHSMTVWSLSLHGHWNRRKHISLQTYDAATCTLIKPSTQISGWKPQMLPIDFPKNILLGQVVQKPVNTNLGLKLNQGFCFSCYKAFALLIFG